MIHLCLSCSESIDCEGFSGYCSACCHRMVDEYDVLKAERDEYRPYYDALRARHNSYDPGFCADVGCPEPATPEQALDELLEEADALAVDAPIHTVLVRLKSERYRLTVRVGELEAERDLLLQEARIHAQEARTQRSTVHEIYQLSTGATGEPGDWHGAEPVRALVAERDRLVGQAKTLRKFVTQLAKQELEEEMREGEAEGGDYRGAYDAIVRQARAALSAPEPEEETRRHLLPSWAHDGDWHCERCNKVFASREACLSDSSNCPGPTLETEKEPTP